MANADPGPFRLEDEEDRLVWILGSSRSGSTWLLKMLAGLDGCVPVDDPHLGHHLGVWRPISLAYAADARPAELRTLREVKRERPGYFFADRYRDDWWQPLRQLIQARFEAQARETMPSGGARPFVVVKEPGSQVAPLLFDLFPASKLIFLLRDGRDVVDSWLAAYREGSWALPEGAFAADRDSRLPLVRWLASVWVYRTNAVREAFDARPMGSRVLIRYEDLRRRTAETLEEACAALGLAAPRQRIRASAERHSFEQVPRERRGPAEPIRAATPGAWRKNLTAAEQDAAEEIMGGLLAELGYAVGGRTPLARAS